MSLSIQYVRGLFQSRNGNIERMVEHVADSEYYSKQHFISESPWDARTCFDTVALDTNEVFKSFDQVALLIDESSHLKKGDYSVGVSRQYCGTIGKVDNCQVAVYAGLSAAHYYGLIDTALYLPESWTANRKRCKAAGVPKEQYKHKTKVELAVDIVRHQLELGTHFDFVGADGLYCNSKMFRDELDDMELLFVLDVHSDQQVYTSAPSLYLPEKQGSSGRNPTRYKTEDKTAEVKDLCPAKGSKKWEEIRLRKTGQDDLVCLGFVKKVYLWDGESGHYEERLLIIRATKTKSGNLEYKYALSNAADGEFEVEELVRMQSQRYFIERSFQDAKQEAGMSDYQVRGWLAWHHHMVLVMMALHFILSEKVLFKNEYPLLSAYDIRDIMIRVYAKENHSAQNVMEQIRKRHEQRRLEELKKDSS
ncbi:IS701 family transposase [Chitinophaga sp. LS1]|uniref:IS701 family transposase n=1 Tax=Chitinophaga sp. LS1 TaxID=3051176 RepID=UPI002AAB5EF0|nr:IS701 family transposase [Chitinophaga sp. LS1]WPV65821.1 IS701 family transposase [Chitinophaga sp. LS1]